MRATETRRWIASALADGVLGLVESETAALRGEVEGVHGMRTSARRLRSDLRVFRSLCDPDWADGLARELRWLGRLLGEVRDLDVLGARLREQAGVRAGDLGPILEPIGRRRETAASALDEALRGGRYEALRARLIQAARDPQAIVESIDRADEALPSLVAPSWRKLRDAARELGPGCCVEALHRVRKRAKRARYSTEAVLPALRGGRLRAARRFAKQAKAIQDILGEHQDAVVAVGEIERALADRSGEDAFLSAASELIGAQRRAMDEARDSFGEAWKRLDRKKNRGWWKS